MQVPFAPGFWRDQVELFRILNSHEFLHCAGCCKSTVRIPENEKISRAIDGTRFVNIKFGNQTFSGQTGCSFTDVSGRLSLHFARIQKLIIMVL